MKNNKKQCDDTFEKRKKVIGVYSEKEGGFGFVDVEGQSKGYFVFSKNKNFALDGDTVEAEIKIYKGRKEAEIIKIIKRKERFIVGTFQKNKEDFAFVLPRNKNFGNDIFIKQRNFLSAKDGDLVSVEIIKWDKKNPEGIVMDVFDKKINEKEEDILSIIIESGVKINFDEKTLNEVKNLKTEDVDNRKNFRNLFTFTIDGEDAKDLDDAISVEKKPNGDFILYVHIADVSHYVKENGNLDKEALSRGTSVYLADRVIPMLPQKLSNDLCSLNPNTDKLTLTIEMIVGSKTGHIIKSRVYNSVINSNYRLTYKDVDEVEKKELIEGNKLQFGGIASRELVNKIKLANQIKRKILEYREKNGMLDFDFKETYIKINEKGDVEGIEEYKKYNSNKMIEAFMVSANEAISKEFKNFPFLYRIHELPNEDDIKELNTKLNFFGVNFQIRKNTPSEFSKLLTVIEKNQGAKKLFLQRLILRTLTEAIYSEKNKGHFGLGLNFYSHFTSPIRRYPDLQIHRIIKEILKDTNQKKHYIIKGNRLKHYKEILPKVAEISSDKEKNAEKLEYKIRDYYIVEYYSDKIGEEFEGFISGMIPKGFFVELNDTSEGFVSMEECVYDENLYSFILNDGKKYTIGDRVKVSLVDVDKTRYRLNFEIIK